jgi:hypothetical protein
MFSIAARRKTRNDARNSHKDDTIRLRSENGKWVYSTTSPATRPRPSLDSTR